jgi:hypothetical protein
LPWCRRPAGGARHHHRLRIILIPVSRTITIRDACKATRFGLKTAAYLLKPTYILTGAAISDMGFSIM